MAAVDGCIFSSDDIVVKSPTDRRLYRYIHLHNGLSAVLVHDPEIYSGESKPSATGEDNYEAEDDDEEDEEDADGERGNGRKDGASHTKKAAAAMCVGMGSFSDPIEAQGLAHFLGYQRRYGENIEKQEHEATEPFIILETASLVSVSGMLKRSCCAC